MSTVLQRAIVAGVVASGAGLIGWAAGGVAEMDGRLAAVTPVRGVADTELVVERRCLRPDPRGEPDLPAVDSRRQL